MDIVSLITEFGFPVVAVVGLGYFVFFVWKFVVNKLDPKIEKMHFQLIRVIDQMRMLDQDLIRLQEKVNVVLEYRERQEVLKDAAEKKALVEKSKDGKVVI